LGAGFEGRRSFFFVLTVDQPSDIVVSCRGVSNDGGADSVRARGARGLNSSYRQECDARLPALATRAFSL